MQRGIRNEVCYLSPRLSLDDIVRKMIIEGVLAVIILNNQSQNQGRVTLQVFDRSGGDSNIKFESKFLYLYCSGKQSLIPSSI